MAKLVAEALFEPVGAKAGRKLPCQLAEEERGLELEKLMYKHICNSVKTWTPFNLDTSRSCSFLVVFPFAKNGRGK